MLNGFGYTMFNIPSRDLETTWREVPESAHSSSSTKNNPNSLEMDDEINAEAALVTREITSRRFAKSRLYTGGKILHIVRRKNTDVER
jgi:sn1-specific diacylglycerol lipase